MARTPKGLPKVQDANQQWVDSVSQHLLDRGFTLGSGTADKKGAAAIQGIRAYHSSPHDFDKFDLSKIGTGEGAQVYGHGLYFAENPAVSGQGGQYWQQFKNRFGDTPEAYAANVLESAKFDRGRATADLDRLLNTYGDNAPVTAREARALLASDQPVGPRTYEVNINADPAHFLDWDNKLPMGSPARPKMYELGEKGMKYHEGGIDRQFAKDSILSAQNELLTGEGALRMMGKAVDQARPIMKAEGDPYALFGSLPAMSSRMLNEAGIPGIKYLDEGSRNLVASDVLGAQKTPQGWVSTLRSQHPSHSTGGTVFTKSMPFPDEAAALAWANEKAGAKPTSNYVVFNPGIIDIMKKYGIAGAAAPVGMGALASQDNYQPEN